MSEAADHEPYLAKHGHYFLTEVWWYDIIIKCGMLLPQYFLRSAGIFYLLAGNSNIMEDETFISSAKRARFFI